MLELDYSEMKDLVQAKTLVNLQAYQVNSVPMLVPVELLEAAQVVLVVLPGLQSFLVALEGPVSLVLIFQVQEDPLKAELELL